MGFACSSKTTINILEAEFYEASPKWRYQGFRLGEGIPGAPCLGTVFVGENAHQQKRHELIWALC